VTLRHKSGTTDQNGHHVLRGLTPGKYKLYAFTGKGNVTIIGPQTNQRCMSSIQ
jgi:hypothetical protein